jgi:6,7-dimethyl-8-ribityllumazine synthase
MSSKPAEVQGDLIVREGQRFAVVISRWNHFISDRLLEGALDAITRHGGKPEQVTIYRVPGSFELPLAALRVAQKGGVDAIIAIGVLIRGATPHFDYIAAEATKGLASASMETGVPIAYGVLTTNSIEQAIERAGTKAGNKGAEAALAAIEMANLCAQL